MLRNVVVIILIMMMAGGLILLSELKDAYKVIPIKAAPTLQVSEFADWNEYSGQSNNFRVSLPQPPQYARESAPIPDTDLKRAYEMYLSEQLNGTIYMISMITYPPQIETSNQNQMLHDFIKELVRSRPDNKLQQETDSSFQDKGAVDFMLFNKDYQMKGIAFMVDKTIYLLTYVANKNNFKTEEFDHFINSFRL